MSPRSDGRLPEPRGVDVWHIRLDGPGWPHSLDAAERARARRDHRYAVAHGVARTVLAAYLGGAPGDLRWGRGVHGKPGFTGARARWRWNLSHSAGHALLAVSVTAHVGVDIERVRPDLGPVDLATRFLPRDEAGLVATSADPATAYHRLLSRKEACVKADGGRILESLHLPVRRAGRVPGHRLEVHDLPAPPGFVAAIASPDLGPLTLYGPWSPRREPAGASMRGGQP
ncbi:4'-phosphopantetheinyl transferase family protein [Actinokineospora sp. 24-640]